MPDRRPARLTAGRLTVALAAAVLLALALYASTFVISYEDLFRAEDPLVRNDVARLAPSMLAKMEQEEYNRLFEGTPLTKAMTKNPLSIAPDAPVVEAVKLMHSRKIGAVPVVENGELVGILTVSDMLGLLHELLGSRAKGTVG